MDLTQLKWSIPITLLVDKDKLWLVAGEDVRYSLSVEEPEDLMELLRNCDGSGRLGLSLSEATPQRRAKWEQILEQLYSERVLVEAAPHEIPCEPPMGFLVLGENDLATDVSKAVVSEPSTDPIRVFCQEDMNYGRALEFNRRAVKEGFRWVWLTSGPSDRAYVGPLMLPSAGPCLDCLFHHFRRLSPEPDLFNALCTASKSTFAPVCFPQEGRSMLAALARWKLSLVGQKPANPALYSLHVLERSSLTVSQHPVFVNPDCPTCQVDRCSE
jgi:bacteriocin biosynthesis cyclodehydratase domain-containing protein